MTELQRVKMTFGDATFEADVPKDRVQPMYDQFLSVLERRSRAPRRPFAGGRPAIFNNAFDHRPDSEERPAASAEISSADEIDDHNLLMRIYDLHQDGFVILKILPNGSGKEADALLLILYGYRRLKNEDYVLATRLLRAAEHSGIFVRRPAHELTIHDRCVVRGGHRKASTYSLTSQGLAKAQEITTKLFA